MLSIVGERVLERFERENHSFGVKLKKFIFGIPCSCTIRRNSLPSPRGKCSGKSAPSLPKCPFAAIAPHHAIHFCVTSREISDVTSTFTLPRAPHVVIRNSEHVVPISVIIWP